MMERQMQCYDIDSLRYPDDVQTRGQRATRAVLFLQGMQSDAGILREFAQYGD